MHCVHFLLCSYFIYLYCVAALRASLGHPDPYALTYVEIGNEDFADQGNTYASYRWADMVNRLSSTFPQLSMYHAQYLIHLSLTGFALFKDFLATTFVNNPVLSPAPKFYDVHMYSTPGSFPLAP